LALPAGNDIRIDAVLFYYSRRWPGFRRPASEAMDWLSENMGLRHQRLLDTTQWPNQVETAEALADVGSVPHAGEGSYRAYRLCSKRQRGRRFSRGLSKGALSGPAARLRSGAQEPTYFPYAIDE